MQRLPVAIPQTYGLATQRRTKRRIRRHAGRSHRAKRTERHTIGGNPTTGLRDDIRGRHLPRPRTPGNPLMERPRRHGMRQGIQPSMPATGIRQRHHRNITDQATDSVTAQATDGTPNRQSNTNTGRTRTIITQIHAHTRAQTPLAARESHSRRTGSRRSGSLCRERATNTARTGQSRGNPQRTRQGSPTRRAVGGERPGAYSGQEGADPGRHCDHRDNHAPVRRSDTWGAGECGGRIGARRRPTAC